jgi:hypothetical protein
MYYWLIDSGGILPEIQGDLMVDESVTDSGAAVLSSVKITVRSNGPLRVEGDPTRTLRALIQTAVLRRHPPRARLEVRGEPDPR